VGVSAEKDGKRSALRVTVFLAIFSLAASAASAQTQYATIFANKPCSEFLQVVEGERDAWRRLPGQRGPGRFITPGYGVLMGWFLGFMSATNMFEPDVEFLGSVSNRINFVENFCRRNPLNDQLGGVLALLDEERRLKAQRR
jgi:hypothetical protein